MRNDSSMMKDWRLAWFLETLVLLHTACLFFCSDASSSSCSGRQVLNASSGVITDGSGAYTASAHCEWLIVAEEGKFINLEFVSMDTECSYDYLFIYDGFSYSSPLLGSFSGNTLPDKVLARSGYMLIYFFSDRNYYRNGFYAIYNMTDCPADCNKRGLCNNVTHTCHCQSGYTGESCALPPCPDFCSGHGECNFILGQCDCDEGYAGQDCRLSMRTNEGQGTWLTVAPDHTGFRARAAHASVFVKTKNSLYVFGGNTLNEILGDFVRYDFKRNMWIEVECEDGPWPDARHSHAIAAHNHLIFIYGGALQNGSHSDELWSFDTVSEKWELLAVNSSVRPKAVESHTLTLVDSQWLYLFGGRTSKGEYISDIYRIDVNTSAEWELMVARGGKSAKRRLVGHSTIYHPESRSLLVFGGFLPDYARFPKRTNDLHAYHIDENYWSQIHFNLETNFANGNVPNDRAFHSAALMGNYMVIFGGNAHIHHNEEVCYDHDIYFYHLGCHRWIELEPIEVAFADDPHSAPRGRFSHSAVPAFGNTLLVAGGYRGSVLGDLVAYTVPVAIAKNEEDATYADHCLQYEYIYCQSDPECVWCMERSEPASPGCMARNNVKNCKKDYRPGYCPGICETLSTCLDCTIQGQGAVIHNSSLANVVHNGKCAWCVKGGQCQKVDVYEGLCNASVGTDSGIEGYWGKNSSRLTAIQDCRLENYPAGLHLIKHRYPPNWNQPDDVEITRSTSANFQFDSVFDGENAGGGYFTALLKGFLHPLGAPSSNGNPIRVSLVSAGAQSWLYMSPNQDPSQKELIAEIGDYHYGSEIAERPSGLDIFPNEARGYRYYVEQKAIQNIAEPKKSQIASTMQIEWTGALSATSRIRQIMSIEFLEPFNNGTCQIYETCLACMTDIQCGWCLGSSVCLPRVATGLSHSLCGTSDNSAPHLVTDASECDACSDFVNCHTCTDHGFCEWLTSEARCVRLGRFEEAVTQTSLCPVPCQERTTCATCLEEKNECTWCEQTSTCFPFVEYIMRYSYGGCTWWIDSMSDHQCQNCSRHSTCSACIADHGCGWCGNVNNPLIGGCLEGDFTDQGSNCSLSVQSDEDIAPAEWSYGFCPDVEECRLGLHDCHENATCINTFSKYACQCNRGFIGDGVETCDRTCHYDCVHGVCSDAPDFYCICDIGWTGLDCSTDCQCNEHSTCDGGVGLCDECVHWTMGKHCEECRPGSFGNATLETGCQPCQCNGHGDESVGYCNRTTGVCSCIHNTYGDQCELCIEGYYGDPRDGRKCYMDCGGRTIVTNISEGALGSYDGAGVRDKSHVYCLWILTVFPSLEDPSPLAIIPKITFIMETDIMTMCSRDYVYIYDGVPEFLGNPVSQSSPNLLASLCGYTLPAPLHLVSDTGYLVVFFEGSIETTSTTRGFNASFHINSCPSHCDAHHHECINSQCVCEAGYGGINCEIELCPQNCTEDLGQGICDHELNQCLCYKGFSGDSCNETVSAYSALLEEISNPWRSEGLHAFSSDLSRMGHTMVSCGGEQIYVFGGFSISRGELDDLLIYDSGEWAVLPPTTDDRPSPRYHHASVCLPTLRALYVFGGLSGGYAASNDMWKYNLDANRWTLIKPRTYVEPPLMAGHTMTAIGDTLIAVIGGFSSELYYSKDVYYFDASNAEWSVVDTTGPKPTGVFGHSAVYHHPSDSIFIYGGYEYQTDKNVPSSNLYNYDIETHMWSLLTPSDDNRPVERFFHTSLTTDKYLIVVGGRTADSDYDGSIAVYRYLCNHWISLDSSYVKLQGASLPSLIGSAAYTQQLNEFFIMGGFDGITQGSLYKLTLPSDPCALISDAEMCMNATGCSLCQVLDTNQTYCYSENSSRPHECMVHNTSLYMHIGQVCDVDWVEQRLCTQHKSCHECTSRWPMQKAHKQVCQWCSNCQTGKCIPRGESCEELNECDRKQRVMIKIEECVEQQCQASDCPKCVDTQECIWTRQFKRASEVGRTLSLVPIYDWNCLTITLLTVSQYEIDSAPPMQCPLRCYEHADCHSCLSSTGGEGGSQQCIWSDDLQECMPPAYLPLRCSNGECGSMLSSQAGQCPVECSVHDKCSDCLSHPGCGWCAFGNLNGLGICMRGGLVRPLDGSCELNPDGVLNVHAGIGAAIPDHLKELMLYSRETPTWSFSKCPSENECLNNHHDCDVTENCTDLDTGFRCDCKAGFIRDKELFSRRFDFPKFEVGDSSSGKCKPVCRQGCEPHGECVEPDFCKCHFGYVGHNCSTECDCNKHSNCLSVIQKNICLECHNNTMGKSCEECKPLYVGNPKDGGTCQSCHSYCHTHSLVCLAGRTLNLTYTIPELPIDHENITRWLKSGSDNIAETVCINCEGNTEGQRCETCQNGFFRPKKANVSSPCIKCQCHGHSDICDKDGGTNCDCKNNTKSDRCEVKDDSKCYLQQCSKCTESFHGTPTNGHQCYRQMTVDQNYCFDPSTQMNCNRQHEPLRNGRTVFFAVQPKYLNVDIRIVLDVTEGAVDVFYSPIDDTYVVDVNEETGIHSIQIDPKYPYHSSSPSLQGQNLRRRKRLVNETNNTTISDGEKVYTMEEKFSHYVHSFITVSVPDTFLVVRNVQNRLVITLPNSVHNLKIARFYLILHGTLFSESYGVLFFRQDQPHIDLFVFFSVFFSCFFLFLAVCVLMWKTKQILDSQRSRHQRRLEMKHMASRPFAKVLVAIDNLQTPDSPRSTTRSMERCRSRMSKHTSKYSLSSSNTLTQSNQSEDHISIVPLASEPTDDGIAAVGTFIFQLPGGSSAPAKACLGSALITHRVMYPNHQHLISKSRRRASHGSVST